MFLFWLQIGEEAEDSHWTERLFIEEGELYREELESRLDRAEKEVKALLRIFSEEGVPPKGRILDLCCGIGRHSILLAERGYQVTGIDLSPVLIARARELAKARGGRGERRIPRG